MSDNRMTELYKKTAVELVNNEDTLLDMLKTAGMNYRESFGNQALIYAQKPDAVNVNTYNNIKANDNYVRAGKHGILILASGTRKPLRVFDERDTGKGAPVVDSLSYTEAIKNMTSVEDGNIYDAVDSLFDVMTPPVAREIAKAITLYHIGADKETVKRLCDLSDVKTMTPRNFGMMALGASATAKDVISEIETIKENLKEKENDIHERDITGRNTDTDAESHIDGRDGNGRISAEQIQGNEGELSQGSLSGVNGTLDSDRGVRGEDGGERQDGSDSLRDNVSEASETERSDNEASQREPARVDENNEHIENDSGRNSVEGDNLSESVTASDPFKLTDDEIANARDFVNEYGTLYHISPEISGRPPPCKE